MILTRKPLSLSRSSVVALALAMSIMFGAGAALAKAMGQKATSDLSNTAEQFAGTWHWMFDGRNFSTMILVRSGSGLTGTVTPTRIALNDDGELLELIRPKTAVQHRSKRQSWKARHCTSQSAMVLPSP